MSVERIALTVDVGPAAAVLGAGHHAEADWSPTWRGLDILCDAFAKLEQHLGAPLNVTWFCRADAVVERQLGSRLRAFEEVDERLERHSRDGDELAWMPQAYTGEGAIDYDDLPPTHEAITTYLDRPLRCVRMGNCSHDDRTMAIVSELGIAVDSSALPGRTKKEGWRLDWRGTPTRPYRPSLADYRVPGEPCHDVLEVPFTMGVVTAPYDDAPLSRHLNLAWQQRYVVEILSSIPSDGSDIVALLHPDEVVDMPADHRHPLGAYSAGELITNISLLRSVVPRHAERGVFARLADLAG